MVQQTIWWKQDQHNFMISLDGSDDFTVLFDNFNDFNDIQ